jgi:CubicO group peptidase (beta-lactamase class C family)
MANAAINWLKPLLAITAILSMQACSTFPSGKPFKPALDQELQTLISTHKPELVNVSALAIRNGQVVYQNQFGRSFINTVPGGQDLPVTDRTLYRIASISKLVTSLAVMRLIEEGKLSLDEDVSKQLGWALRNPNYPDQAITLRHLMSHRSSLTDGPGVYWWDVGVDLRDVLQPGGKYYKANEYWELNEGDKNRAPGQWFNYVNLNWGVIGTIMERATGERFDRLMDRLVFKPLNMRGGFNPADFPKADIADIATQYRKRRNEGNQEVWAPNGPWIVQADDFHAQAPTQPDNIEKYVIGSNGALFGPQGRLRISVTDLSTIMLMLMNNGQHQQATFLKPETVKLLSSEQWRFNPAKPNGESDDGGTTSWALGPQRFSDVGKDRVVEGGGLPGYGHFGDAYGLMATFALDPITKNGLIVVVCGPAVNPSTFPAKWSTMYRWEEIANTAVFKHAILGQPN